MFVSEKERIAELLRKEKTEKLYEDMLSRMRAKSVIGFPK
jgi:hypothetical protein